MGVFFYLSNAFDTIDNKIIIDKLEWYGVRGRALEWFKGYLNNRQQYIQYNYFKSEIHDISCGVPQGSVLGSLLFIIYTNDLPNCLKSWKAILFADDITLYASSANISQLYETINSDLELLTEWFRANKWSLNVGKTHYVVLKYNNLDITGSFEVKIGNKIIEKENCVKFRGILIDSKLEWHDHIRYVQNKMQIALWWSAHQLPEMHGGSRHQGLSCVREKACCTTHS